MSYVTSTNGFFEISDSHFSKIIQGYARWVGFNRFPDTAQKMKISIKDSLSNGELICRKLRI